MLEEKILDDFKKAMKDKDALKVSTLSFLRSELKNTAIDKRKQALDDAEAITVIKKQIKQRHDSIDKFKQGNRQDLADKESRELEILKLYLPQGVSEEEIRAAVDEVVKTAGASSAQDMGKVMKELLARFAGRADNKLVSELVRERLAK